MPISGSQSLMTYSSGISGPRWLAPIADVTGPTRGRNRPVSDPAEPRSPIIERSASPAFAPEMELAELASESVIVFDLAGVVRYWNPASEKLYGWPSMAAVGRSAADLSASTLLHQRQWPVLVREGSWSGLIRRHAASGEHVVADVRQTLRRDSSGEPRDIVEYGRKAEEGREAVARPGSGAHRLALVGPTDDARSLRQLRVSEARYRKLIHRLPIALLQVDASAIGAIFDRLKAQGVADLDHYLDEHPELIDLVLDTVRVTDVNRSAVSLLGGTAPADFMRSIRFLYVASPETIRKIMIARFGGRRSHSEAMKIQALDGRMLDVQLSVTYPASPEQLDVTLLSLEDITERRRTEGRLRQIEADFAHAARLSTLGELATSIAHEVNQPLAAIVTNAETSLRWLSRDDPNIVKVGQLTARIVASARRASDIVQRIRLTAAKHETERVPLDLNEVVDEALLFVRHDLDAGSIDLSGKLEPALPPVVGDRVQLQQVIVNLLVNSIQAITQGDGARRRIDLHTSVDGDGAVSLSVHDSGPGIADDDLERIFDSFFTTKDAGLGIGLAVCQSIIIAHGGNIVASNHPLGGAQFTFSVPAQPEQDA